jgi:hypothetical protein
MRARAGSGAGRKGAAAGCAGGRVKGCAHRGDDAPLRPPTPWWRAGGSATQVRRDGQGVQPMSSAMRRLPGPRAVAKVRAAAAGGRVLKLARCRCPPRSRAPCTTTPPSHARAVPLLAVHCCCLPPSEARLRTTRRRVRTAPSALRPPWPPPLPPLPAALHVRCRCGSARGTAAATHSVSTVTCRCPLRAHPAPPPPRCPAPRSRPRMRGRPRVRAGHQLDAVHGGRDRRLPGACAPRGWGRAGGTRRRGGRGRAGRMARAAHARVGRTLAGARIAG